MSCAGFSARDSEMTFEKTVKWYRAFYENSEVLTKTDLESYINSAKERARTELKNENN